MKRARLKGLGALLVAAALESAGCAEECRPYESRCDGNTLLTCSGDDQSFSWRPRDCGAQECVSVRGQNSEPLAFCAASTRPDPRCIEPDTANCAGSTLVSCSYGYAVEEGRCSSDCITLDGLSDYCLEARPTHPDHCQPVGTEGRCELESSVLNTQIGVAPGAICSADQVLDASSVGLDTAEVYATNCDGGTLRERKRCDAGCAFTADCTTRCLE